MFKKLMKEWHGGSYIFMKSTPRYPDDRPLMAIRYKYSFSSILVFIATEGGGSNETGVPYLYFFYDNYYNFFI